MAFRDVRDELEGVAPDVLYTQQFRLMLGNSKIPGSTNEIVIGENRDLGAGVEEDIWDCGGKINFLTSAQPLYVSSTDAADVGNTLVLRGLDENYDEQLSFVVLNGQNQVRVGADLTWLRAFFMATAVTETQGNVYLAEQDTLTDGVPDTPSKVQGCMRQDSQVTHNGYYTVPRNKTADLFLLTASVAKGKDARFRFKARPFGGVFLEGDSVPLYQTNFARLYDYSAGFDEKNDFLLSAISDNAGTRVNATAILAVLDKDLLGI